ncbi:MAG: hypothetical protein DRN15_02145 [Thermoprotei archaeon]|nr:MAG: hypothetical protein DRM97_05575 [Thermoprotei archaeon]RLF24758.1 MAG: hypothetical protein DRN15_02145 [Thermoprotei archaeon]
MMPRLTGLKPGERVVWAGKQSLLGYLGRLIFSVFLILTGIGLLPLLPSEASILAWILSLMASL